MNYISLDKVVIRIAGDSGDGIQLIGNKFSDISVIDCGNDVYTFVEFPSEIRAPVGSLSGISGFQLTISSKKIFTVDSKVDLLFVFNPAALKINLNYLKDGGILILDSDSFNDKNLKKAGYSNNPLENENLFKNTVIQVPLTKLTCESVKDCISSVSKAKKSKNFFALGMICWIYDRKINALVEWLEKKFKNPEIYLANKKSLLAGYNYCDTIELFNNKFIIPKFFLYNNNDKVIKISGNKAFALGAVSSTFIFKLPLFSANYPITPASDIFHELLNYSNDNIKIIQLEDEIASINAIIGASYGGSLSFTCTSGPGLDLMQEGIGLAIMSELPIVVINVQRSGPSTGIPTKSEQTDLLSSIFGRHGESKVIVIAPDSPNNCFFTIIEAFYFSIISLSPVIILSDSNLANSSEMWKIPNKNEIFDQIKFESSLFNNVEIINNNMWNIPGYCDKIFCIGGLERDLNTGNVSHDPTNHFNMVKKRFNKINDITNFYNVIKIIGKSSANLIIAWGSVCGLLKSLYNEINSNEENHLFSILCLRYLYPLPNDLFNNIKNFNKIILIEENMGHLYFLFNSHYKLNILNINQVTGKPFDFIFLKQQILNIL